MQRLRFAFVLFLLAVSVAAPAAAQTVMAVAAVVNDEEITTYQVEQRMRLIIVSNRIRPTPELIERIRAQALRSLIDEKLQLQEAQERELEITEADVMASLDDLASSNGVSRDVILEDLRATGVDFGTLEHQMKAEIAWQALVSGRYNSQVRISDNQIELALDRIAADASKTRYRISEIFLSGTEAELATQVDAIQQQLASGAPFAALARQFSTAPSASDGGEAGWVFASQLDPAVERALTGLEIDAVSGPIETIDGVWIVALHEKQSGVDITRVTLKQLFIPLDSAADASTVSTAENALNKARRRLTSCEAVDRAAKDVEGSRAIAIDQASLADLAPELRAAVEGLDVGQASGVVRVQRGAAITVLCGRNTAVGAGLPTREEVEQRLRSEMLGNHAREYLAKLRRDAMIETRIR